MKSLEDLIATCHRILNHDPENFPVALEDVEATVDAVGPVIVLGMTAAELFRRELTHTEDAIAIRKELNALTASRGAKFSFDA